MYVLQNGMLYALKKFQACITKFSLWVKKVDP
jgi:hypothetical protein